MTGTGVVRTVEHVQGPDLSSVKLLRGLRGTAHGCISRALLVAFQENEAEGIPEVLPCLDFLISTVVTRGERIRTTFQRGVDMAPVPA